MPTLFWTDGLFFVLLFLSAVLIVRMRGREHLRRPWRKVARSRSAMVSLVILTFYLSVGVLDSVRFYPVHAQNNQGDVHFKTEALSLLDWWATPIRTRVEKTYSAPLAAYAYSKENIRGADGSIRWDYPRLEFGGAHLADPERERLGDILATAVKGLLEGLLLWMFLTWLLAALRARLNRIPARDSLRQMLKAGAEPPAVDSAYVPPPGAPYPGGGGTGTLQAGAPGGDSTALATGVPWRAVLITLLLLCLAGFCMGELSLKYHVLGTDKVGEDVFYQSLKSIRTGLLIGTLTTFVTLPLSLVLGILAGYFRGWVDDVIQYLYTTLNSIPGVLLIAAAILVMQVYMAKHEDEFASLALRADFRLLFLCLILGMTSWTGLCRLLRAETLKLREMEYVQAASALGVRTGVILLRHILPNVFHLVLISVALDFSSLVLAEAVLSYVNIGVDPTTDSWGNMINSARLEMAREPIVWWSLAAAFLFMFALVLAANLFADAVRDAFDPRRAD
jgi:peptide/nickel transport system permease protein